jgi:cytochrome c oxidase cbb3-type subunit 2
VNFHINARLLFGMAFLGFVALTLLIAIIPAYQIQKTPPTPGLQPLSAEAGRGMKLYVAEGCSYCHSQQVRPLRLDEPFGRPSAAGDYVYQTPELLGTERTGPDLSNIGGRQASQVWHLMHLYNPRSVVGASVMPAYSWYFEVRDQAGPQDVVVPVPADFTPAGKVVVAKPGALALAAYLLSLKQLPLKVVPDAGTPDHSTGPTMP